MQANTIISEQKTANQTYISLHRRSIKTFRYIHRCRSYSLFRLINHYLLYSLYSYSLFRSYSDFENERQRCMYRNVFIERLCNEMYACFAVFCSLMMVFTCTETGLENDKPEYMS